VPVLVLALAFTGAALLTFDIEWRHHVQRFTLSDAPMVVALFTLPPWQVVVARVLGEAVAAVLDRERRPLKILVNFSILVAECVAALLAFHLLVDSLSVATPTAWAAALVAVVLMDTLSLVAITTVIRWHGGQAALRDTLPTAVGAAVANGCLGVTVTLLLYVHAAAALLAVTTTAVLFLASRGYSNLRQRYSSLQLLHDFSEAIGGALRAEDVVESMLAYARRLLHADVAELVVFAEAGQSAFRARLRGDEPMVKEPLGDVDALRATTYAGRCVVAPRGSQGGLADYLSGVGVDDGICAPLTVGDGMTGAFIVAQRLTDRRTFDEDDARVFQTLANHATMALEKGRLIEKLRAEAARRQYQAMHDTSPGLPNRAMFLESAARRIDAAEVAGDPSRC
jgi:K+-sensing histidine kinase KdpD